MLYNGTELRVNRDYTLSGSTLTFTSVLTGAISIVGPEVPQTTAAITTFTSSTQAPGGAMQVTGWLAPMIPQVDPGLLVVN